MPNNVNFCIWLGKSHSPRPIVGRAHRAAHSRRAVLSVGQLRLVGQFRLTMRSVGMRFTQFLLVGHLRLDGSSESVSRRVAPSRRQLRLVMCSICMRYRQLLFSDNSVLRATVKVLHRVSLPVSGSVLSKTAIFPKKKGRKREISNESARGSSLRKANV